MLDFRAFLKLWLPVLVWMSLIFTASADSHSYQHSSRLFEPLLRWLFPQMPQAEVEKIHHLFRKSCHLAEYAVLALLLFRALSPSEAGRRQWASKKIGAILFIVFVYAGSDEFHQHFVPTRTSHFTDVLIDTAGGALGLFALWLFQNFQNKIRN